MQITVTSISFRRMLLNDDTGSPQSVRSICLTSGNQKAKPSRLAATGTSYVPRTCNGEHGAVLMTGRSPIIGNHPYHSHGSSDQPWRRQDCSEKSSGSKKGANRTQGLLLRRFTTFYNMKPSDLTPPDAGHKLIRGPLPRGKSLPFETQVPRPVPGTTRLTSQHTDLSHSQQNAPRYWRRIPRQSPRTSADGS